jgi:hypothetical protein
MEDGADTGEGRALADRRGTLVMARMAQAGEFEQVALAPDPLGHGVGRGQRAIADLVER